MGKKINNLSNNDKRELKIVQKKRNLILFFLVSSLIILVTLFFILWKVINIKIDLLVTIYIIISLFLLGFVLYIKNYVQTLDMKYKYLKILENKKKPYKLTKPIFTETWVKQFITKHNFLKFKDLDDVTIFYKYLKKDRKNVYIKKVMLIACIAKTENLDFYSNRIDNLTKEVYKTKHTNKTEKHIVLQFKEYKELLEKNINEIEQIINFKTGRFQVIQLTIGYFRKENKVYFLEPNKIYPSKAYYYAIREIKKIVGINEEKQE